jgi:hypothetical protein
MGQFLNAAYHLRIKNLYDGMKERKIPNRLNPGDSFMVNRKRITKFVLPFIPKAYREGVDYATVVVKQQHNQDIEKDYRIDAKMKDKLLLESLAHIMNAENVYRLKQKGYQKIKELQPGITKREDPQKEQIWNEYVNAVKAAVNNLFIRAGHEGTLSVYRKIK